MASRRFREWLWPLWIALRRHHVPPLAREPAIAFAKFFAGMVGVTTGNEGATDADINNAASYQDLARKLTPDAVVQRMP